MKILIEEGAQIDATNVNGQTPLHLACLAKSHDVVALLLEAGADYESRNIEGDCPTHLAVKVRLAVLDYFAGKCPKKS